MRVKRFLLPATALVLLLGVALLWLWTREREHATGHLRIVDEHGAPTTAVVCLTDLTTGEPVLPTGEPAVPITTQAYYQGLAYDGSTDWVGPVRKTNGPGDNDDRSHMYDGRPSLPWWTEPVGWQAGPELDLTLLEGRYRLAITRGPELVPLVQEIELSPDRPLELEIQLERWVDMADRGWHSGDIHVHHPTVEPAQRAFLLHQGRAADLQVVNALQLGQAAGFNQAFDQLPLCDGPCIVAGVEEQRITEGHTLGLHVRIDVDDIDPARFAAKLHEQGALFGFAHFPFQGPVASAFTADVTLEELDFIETLQFAHSHDQAWAEYLDLGFRLTVAAGSDVPWGSLPGEVRTYVHVDGPFSVDAWFEGLAAGRTFVTSGPMLDFEVDGALPGSELSRTAGDEVQLRARVWAHPAICQPTRLTVWTTGGTELASETGEGDLEIALPVPVDQSRWLTVSAECDNGATAHSTPVYVVVDGQPTWSTDRGRQLVQRRLADLDALQATLGDHPVQQALSAQIDRARTFYQGLAIPKAP